MSRISAEEIRRQLDDRIESVLDALNPGWERKGDTAYLTPKSKKDLGSFTVSLGGSSKMPRGCWHRFSQGVGGGSVELVAYLTENDKSRYREAFTWAKDFLGIEERRQETPEEAAEREKRIAAQKEQKERETAQRKAEAEERAAERTLTAAEIWKGTIPLKGTHGEAYLVERGLPPISDWPWNPDLDLRFHPALYYEKMGRFPCIIGRVADPFGVGSGVWRIFLDKKLPRKADVPNAKLGLGPASGGAVRLGGRGSRVGIAEGIESALAAWVLLGFRYPVWAGLSTSGMQGFEPPMEVEQVVIVPDSDRGLMDRQGRISDPPGIAAAKKLKTRMDAAGIRCNILQIPSLGDALDLLNTRRKHEQKAGSTATSNQSSGGTNSFRQGIKCGV